MLSKPRVIHHVTLCVLSLATIALFYWAIDSDRSRFLFSMSTAYVALVLLGLSAVIGPIKLLMGQRSLPVSTYLRRDIGIWAGIIAIVHVFFGLQGHVGGKFWYYFLAPPSASYNFPLRLDWFGLASFLGLGAILIILLLLFLSNDKSISRYGIKRWKFMQRFSYFAILMTFLHTIIFLVTATRGFTYIAMFSTVGLSFFTFQALGYYTLSQKRK